MWMTGVRGVIGLSWMLRLELDKWTDDAEPPGATVVPGGSAIEVGGFWTVADTSVPTFADTGGEGPDTAAAYRHKILH